MGALWTAIANLYRAIARAVSDAYSYAVSQGNRAYKRAKSWAGSEIGKVKALAYSLLSSAKYHARDLVNAVKAWWVTEGGKIKALTLSLWTSARHYARDLVNNVKTWWLTESGKVKALALSLLTSAKYFARGLVDAVKSWWITESGKIKALAYSLMTSVKYWVRDLVKDFVIISPDILDKLITLFSVWWYTLAAFLQNPTGFILSFLVAYILPVLEWSLAYAIDPHNPDLPPWPDWGGGVYGGAIYPGKGPPPGASGLAPPLDHLYISGYVFRPGHPGLDLGLTIGTSVYAMHDGKVLFSGWDSCNYGLTVVIQGKEWWTRYAHLSKLGCSVGQEVSQSQTIGLGGSTGNSTGPHLHLEIKHNGVWIDPVTVLDL